MPLTLASALFRFVCGCCFITPAYAPIFTEDDQLEITRSTPHNVTSSIPHADDLTGDATDFESFNRLKSLISEHASAANIEAEYEDDSAAHIEAEHENDSENKRMEDRADDSRQSVASIATTEEDDSEILIQSTKPDSITIPVLSPPPDTVPLSSPSELPGGPVTVAVPVLVRKQSSVSEAPIVTEKPPSLHELPIIAPTLPNEPTTVSVAVDDNETKAEHDILGTSSVTVTERRQSIPLDRKASIERASSIITAVVSPSGTPRRRESLTSADTPRAKQRNESIEETKAMYDADKVSPAIPVIERRQSVPIAESQLSKQRRESFGSTVTASAISEPVPRSADSASSAAKQVSPTTTAAAVAPVSVPVPAPVMVREKSRDKVSPSSTLKASPAAVTPTAAVATATPSVTPIIPAPAPRKTSLPVAQPAIVLKPGQNPLLSLGIPKGALTVAHITTLLVALTGDRSKPHASHNPSLLDSILTNLTYLHIFQFVIAAPRSITATVFKHFIAPIIDESKKKKLSPNGAIGMHLLKFFYSNIESMQSTSAGLTLTFRSNGLTLDAPTPDFYVLTSKHARDPYLVHTDNTVTRVAGETRRLVFAKTVRLLIDSQRGLYGINSGDLCLKKFVSFNADIRYERRANVVDKDSNGRVIIRDDGQKPVIEKGHYLAMTYDDWLVITVFGTNVEIGLPRLHENR